MNDGVLDAIRHNVWATDLLLETCAQLDETQLKDTVSGTQGTIEETLWHLVSSDAGYCGRLAGEHVPWDRHTDEFPGIAELRRRNADLAVRWDGLLAQQFDAERIFVMDWEDGTYREVPAGIVLAQALHHGSEHRSQVATILTQLGVEPPEWGVWEFAAATNRAPICKPPTE